MLEVDQARLNAANQRFRSMPKEIKNDLRRYQRQEAGPIFKQEVKFGVGSNPLASTVFKSGNTVKAGAIITLRSASSTRRMSGGATRAELMKEAEFGSLRRDKYTKYQRRSPNGKVHNVTRRAGRQIPMRRRGGYVIYPAAGRSTKRIVSLSVQTITRRIYDSI